MERSRKAAYSFMPRHLNSSAMVLIPVVVSWTPRLGRKPYWLTESIHGPYHWPKTNSDRDALLGLPRLGFITARAGWP